MVGSKLQKETPEEKPKQTKHKLEAHAQNTIKISSMMKQVHETKKKYNAKSRYQVSIAVRSRPFFFAQGTASAKSECEPAAFSAQGKKPAIFFWPPRVQLPPSF